MKRLMKSNASKPPAVFLVLCGMSNTAYRRTDGVYAVQIPQLRDLFLASVSGHFKTSVRVCGALERKIRRSLAVQHRASAENPPFFGGKASRCAAAVSG